MRHLNIRIRLTLAYTIGLGVLLTAWTAALYRTAKVRSDRQIDSQVEGSTMTVRPFFNVSKSEVAWLYDKRAVEESAYPVAFAIFDEGGRFLDGSALASIYNLQFTSAAASALQSRASTWETTRSSSGHEIRARHLPITGSDGRAYVFCAGILIGPAEEDLSDLVGSLAALIPLAVVFAGVAGWWLAGDALQPVAHIAATAHRISASNLDQRLPLRGTADELDKLSATLNEMITRLQLSFDQMNHFISNVAHELRTPLAALRGSCEITLRSAKSEKECRNVLQSNIEELDRLAGTVSELLALARAEAGHIRLNCKPHNLTEAVRDAVEAMRPLADGRGISIRCATPAEVTAEVDIQHLLRLLINLLDNAIKYNRQQGWVEVSLQASDHEVTLSVADSGRGIPPEDLHRIFDRFYRSRGENEEGVSGAGLGLGMARWVAAAHGGRIEVESKVGEGSTFRLRLPRTHQVEGQTLATTPAMAQPWMKMDSGSASSGAGEAVDELSLERWSTLSQYAVRVSYWLGMGCAGVALLWRALVDLGVPVRLSYGAGEIGYAGFLNAAFLFLLIATATAGYLLVRDKP